MASKSFCSLGDSRRRAPWNTSRSRFITPMSSAMAPPIAVSCGGRNRGLARHLGDLIAALRSSTRAAHRDLPQAGHERTVIRSCSDKIEQATSRPRQVIGELRESTSVAQ